MSSEAGLAGTGLLLSTSRLAPGVGHGTVARMIQASRRNNRASGLHGVLVFDGERFFHAVEGRLSALQGLESLLEADVRHVERRVLLRLQGHGDPWFSLWSSGFCNSEDLDALFGAGALEATGAWPLVQALMTAADLSE